MADKKLNEVTKVKDMAYVPVIMADGSIGQIAKADLASVVAGVINNIGGLFYTKFLTGTYSVNTTEEAVGAAKEVVASLPNIERCMFMAIHQYYGERIMYGYFYGKKSHGSIFIYQGNNVQFHIDISQGEYIVR